MYREYALDLKAAVIHRQNESRGVCSLLNPAGQMPTKLVPLATKIV